tara:strand:- start:1262 stop:1453 length:192 start_codon:yes stop_codon:yes gene_type:complete
MSGIPLLIFECIISFDLKKGPINSNILPLISEDKLGPKILKIKKLNIVNKNCIKYLINFILNY